MTYTVCFLFTPDGESVLMHKTENGPYAGRLNGIDADLIGNCDARMNVHKSVIAQTGITIPLTRLLKVATIDYRTQTYDRDERGHCLYYYAGMIYPDEIHPKFADNFIWVPTQIVRHAAPNDLRFAGDGDIPYIVNLAAARFNFRDYTDIEPLYRVLEGNVITPNVLATHKTESEAIKAVKEFKAEKKYEDLRIALETKEGIPQSRLLSNRDIRNLNTALMNIDELLQNDLTCKDILLKERRRITSVLIQNGQPLANTAEFIAEFADETDKAITE